MNGKSCLIPILLIDLPFSDCPQVQCIKKYVPQEPDELALEESDVVNVFKKLEDGRIFYSKII